MRSALFFTVCVAVLTLTGCRGAFNPYDRQPQWAETGAADETIAQQAATKSDLISGQSTSTTSGIAAVAGVEKAMTLGTASGLETPTAMPSGN